MRWRSSSRGQGEVRALEPVTKHDILNKKTLPVVFVSVLPPAPVHRPATSPPRLDYNSRDDGALLLDATVLDKLAEERARDQCRECRLQRARVRARWYLLALVALLGIALFALVYPALGG